MENTALRTLESCGQLSETTLKRALWEDLAATLCGDGVHVNVANRSYGGNGTGHTYTVTLAVDGTPSSCTCPDNTFNGNTCKHLVFVARQSLLLASARSIQSGAARADGGELRTDGGSVEEVEEVDDDVGGVSGPHTARDGRDVYSYWRCENCSLETVDSEIKNGCWRCGAGAGMDAALEPERDAELVAEEDEREWAVCKELKRRAERVLEQH